MLSRWPTTPFEIVPIAPTTMSTTLVWPSKLSFLHSLAFGLLSLTFSFSPTPASPGTAILIIWQTACCLPTTTRSDPLCSRWWSVWMLKPQKILPSQTLALFQGLAHTICQQQFPIRTFCRGTNRRLLQHHHVYLKLYSFWANTDLGHFTLFRFSMPGPGLL